MADAETCTLTPSHAPKPASIRAFNELLPEIKRKLVHLRHEHDKHEPRYFRAVSQLSDEELAAFDESDLVAVRVGDVAYGLIVFGKVRIPAAKGAFFFVRLFVGGSDKDGEGTGVEYKFHSIYNEAKRGEDGVESFKAIMGENDVSSLSSLFVIPSALDSNEIPVCFC